MGERGGGALSLSRFHLSPFPQKRLMLRLHAVLLVGQRKSAWEARTYAG